MTYAAYTRDTTEPLKRMVHVRRFRQVIKKIAVPLNTDIVLDYGCGDGHLFSHIEAARLVGYDPNPALLAEASDEVRALLTADIESLKRDMAHRFSMIYCMEVCEHLTDSALAELFANIKLLAAPYARIIFGVPIETGPSGFVKNIYRIAKNMRYPASIANALRSLVSSKIERPVTDIEWHGDHTGFDHKEFQETLRSSGFKIKRTNYLPLSWTRSFLNNEVYFVCSIRSPAADTLRRL